MNYVNYLRPFLIGIAHPFLGIAFILYLTVLAPHIVELSTCENTLLKQLYVSSLINTICYPTLLVLLLKQLKFISSFKLSSYKERIPIILGSMIFFFWSWRVAYEHECLHFLPTQLLLGAFIATIFMVILNSFVRFSFHAVAFGSFCFVLITSILVAQISATMQPIPILIYCLLILYLLVQICYAASYPNKIEWLLGAIIGILSQSIALLFK